ncbi:MAG: Rrf2 family transcriptional regulator [Candidatus Moraniibacteriota bacterium]
MKVSKKAYYGLRAVLALAQVRKPLSIHTLSKLEHLPEDYLEKILQSLRKSGIVVAQKGVSGGYALAKKEKDISMWDIVRTLDGPVKTFEPPKEKTGALPCPQVSHCQSNEVWRILEESIEKTLSKISLNQLIPKG